MSAFTQARSADIVTATCVLKSPPEGNKIWRFAGNQVVWIKITNSHVIFTAFGSITCDSYVSDTPRAFSLLPNQSTEEIKYSKFGYTTIAWQFSINLVSQTALIIANARWDKF